MLRVFNIISVTDSLDLTLGARYVDDSKDGAFDQLDANTPACNASLTALGSLTADPSGTVAALAPHLPAGVLEAITGPGGGPAAFLNCVPLFAPAVGSVLPLRLRASRFFLTSSTILSQMKSLYTQSS